jgi:hypothetical protein
VITGSGRLVAVAALLASCGRTPLFDLTSPAAISPDAADSVAPSPDLSAPGPDRPVDTSGSPAGLLALDPAAHDFAPTMIGGTDAFTFRASNRGGAPLTSLTVVLAGVEFALPASANRCVPGDLAPRASCAFDVQFRPRSPGGKSGTVLVSASGQTARAALAGTARSEPGEGIVISPAVQTFAGSVGVTGASVAFSVANLGSTPTGAVSVTFGGPDALDFVVASNPCVIPLSPGSACRLLVALRGRTPGMKAATLTVTASPGGSASAQLTATVVAEALTIRPSSADFGMVAVDSRSPPIAFSARNASTGAIGPLLVLLSDGNFATSADACTGIRLLAGDSCTLSVVFQPRTPGARKTLLTVGISPSVAASAPLAGVGF